MIGVLLQGLLHADYTVLGSLHHPARFFLFFEVCLLVRIAAPFQLVHVSILALPLMEQMGAELLPALGHFFVISRLALKDLDLGFQPFDLLIRLDLM